MAPFHGSGPPRRTERARPAYRVYRNGRRGRLRRTLALIATTAVAAGAAAAGLATGAGEERDAASAPPWRASPPPSDTADATPSPESLEPRRLEVLRAGRGARGAEIVRPAGTEGLPVVVFLHGWGLVARSDYRPWIRHLARGGNQVIVPRYQRDARSDPARALPDALAGIRAALRRAPASDGRLVVAGHSAGAALAADYASAASARRLPAAAGVLAVYPGRRIIGYPGGIPEVDPARIRRATRLVVMAGANDVVVGREPAQQLVTRAVRVPASHKRYVLVRRPSISDHYGPTRSTRAARRTFWTQLDRLIRATL